MTIETNAARAIGAADAPAAARRYERWWATPAEVKRSPEYLALIIADRQTIEDLLDRIQGTKPYRPPGGVHLDALEGLVRLDGLADETGRSRSGVQESLRRLARAGWISKRTTNLGLHVRILRHRDALLRAAAGDRGGRGVPGLGRGGAASRAPGVPESGPRGCRNSGPGVPQVGPLYRETKETIQIQQAASAGAGKSIDQKPDELEAFCLDVKLRPPKGPEEREKLAQHIRANGVQRATTEARRILAEREDGEPIHSAAWLLRSERFMALRPRPKWTPSPHAIWIDREGWFDAGPDDTRIPCAHVPKCPPRRAG